MPTLTEIWAWIQANYEYLLFALALGLTLYFQGKERLKALVYALMLEAEKLAKEQVLGGGPEKLEFVLGEIYEVLPRRVQAVLGIIAALRGKTTEQLIKDIAQAWYDTMKSRFETDATRLAFGTPPDW